jgi:hypothetical protein
VVRQLRRGGLETLNQMRASTTITARTGGWRTAKLAKRPERDILGFAHRLAEMLYRLDTPEHPDEEPCPPPWLQIYPSYGLGAPFTDGHLLALDLVRQTFSLEALPGGLV